jgi:Skp family chaperone for outer membrane proteins
MKKTLLTSLFISAAVLSSAHADSLPAPVIGIVEQATLDKSAAFQDIIKQVDQKRTEVQKEMAAYENELKDKDKELAENPKKLSEKDLAAQRQVFEKRVQEVQEKLEIRRAQMELGVEEAKKTVYQAFLKAAEDVMKEVGANVMIYKETVITANSGFDLTPKVLDKLNKDLPNVKVSFKSEADVKKQLTQQLPQAQK